MPRLAPSVGLQLSRPVIALVVLAVLALGGSGAALLFGGGEDAPPTIAVTISSTPDANSTDSDNGTAVAALGEDATATNTPTMTTRPRQKT